MTYRSGHRRSIIRLDVFIHKNCGDHHHHMETMDPQDRRNCAIKVLDGGGDAHKFLVLLMKVRLPGIEVASILGAELDSLS